MKQPILTFLYILVHEMVLLNNINTIMFLTICKSIRFHDSKIQNTNYNILIMINQLYSYPIYIYCTHNNNNERSSIVFFFLFLISIQVCFSIGTSSKDPWLFWMPDQIQDPITHCKFLQWNNQWISIIIN